MAGLLAQRFLQFDGALLYYAIRFDSACLHVWFLPVLPQRTVVLTVLGFVFGCIWYSVRECWLLTTGFFGPSLMPFLLYADSIVFHRRSPIQNFGHFHGYSVPWCTTCRFCRPVCSTLSARPVFLCVTNRSCPSTPPLCPQWNFVRCTTGTYFLPDLFSHRACR
jgi:hypothetical protein